jgi:hypothetical protein
MSEQLDLVEAIERVKQPERNQYEECLIESYEWLDHQRDGVRFTAGMLAKEVISRNICIDPIEPRVWGAVIRELVKRKRIRRTGTYTQEGRTHRGIACVWEVHYGR